MVLQNFKVVCCKDIHGNVPSSLEFKTSSW